MSSTRSETTPLLSLDGNNRKSATTTATTSTTNPPPPSNHHSSSSFWDQLLFTWFTPLLEEGYVKQTLDPDDLHLLPLPEDCQTTAVSKAFVRHWNANTTNDTDDNNGHRLIAALWQAYGREYMVAGGLKLVHDLCVFVGPQVLHALIVYLRTPNAPWWQGLAWTAAVTVSQLTMSLCLRHYFFLCYRTGLRVRTALVQAVTHQALHLSTAPSESSTTTTNDNDTTTTNNNNNTRRRRPQTLGEITNLVSVDAQRLQDLPNFLHALWYSPLQIGLALIFLWQQLGAPSLGGVAVIVLTIPLTKSVAQAMGRRQQAVMTAKDARVTANTEVLTNMKILKFQAWEERFVDRIQHLRKVELQHLWNYLVGYTGTILIWNFTPLLVALATFTAYVFSGHELDVASALTSLSLFAILRFPLLVFPRVINNAVESLVAVKRIQAFLQAPQHVPLGAGTLVDHDNDDKDNDTTTTVLQLDHVTASYYHSDKETATTAPADTKEPEEEQQALLSSSSGNTTEPDEARNSSVEVCLHDVSLSVNRGELIAVVGGVGCGKSSVVQTLLGNVPTFVQGHASRLSNTTLAYFAQTPFLLNATVQDNILFQHVDDTDQDEALYQRALTACALRHDLELFPQGDQTEIGEKGLNLSGGQKARIALARAVYHQADVTVLDDPLSAVDAHVAHHLFQQAICGALLDSSSSSNSNKKRSVVLVTNALQHLSHPAVTRIVVLRQGHLVEQGTYQELASNPQSVLAQFLQVIQETSVQTIVEEQQQPDATTPDNAESCAFPRPSTTSSSRATSTGTHSSSADSLRREALEMQRMSSTSRRTVSSADALIEAEQRRCSCNRKALLEIYQLEQLEDDEADMGGDPQANATESSTIPTADAPRVSWASASYRASERSTASKRNSSSHRSNQEQESANAKLMTEEKRAVGMVSWSVYKTWIDAAGGMWAPILILIGFTLSQSATVASGWWLTYWSGHASETSQTQFLLIYAYINAAAIVIGGARMLLMAVIFLRATRHLFQRMLTVVVHAPMSFYDTTPVGRLVNRFSKDINTTDEGLMPTLMSYIATLFDALSTVVVISGVTPVFALCLVPMILYYLREQSFFMITYRELKRMDSVFRSPIHALLGESVDGVTTIRAYQAENTLLRRLTKLLDTQQHAYYLTCAAQSWLAVRLEMIGTLIITFACLSAIVQHWRYGADVSFAGLAGLAISYSLQVTQSLNWSARMASDMDANMVSVERIDEYSRLENEAARRTPLDDELEGKWPSQGSIVFRGAKLRYRPGLPLVLKGLDLSIPGGSKVGVVGRTGAGKSTLMVALMRIVELAEGRIDIDGRDISQIGLAMLRRNMAVIPQDPILFSGSIRTNLDPFEEYQDSELYETLEHVGLYAPPPSSSTTGTEQQEASQSMDHGIACIQTLEDVVAEGGLNFSVGQRQLLVIGRALLQGSKIVIMDEATAAVDAATDAAIQKVIRTEFVHATCITVAHRINTIMDSDLVLVMDDGRAAEFDSPTALMKRPKGMFRGLVVASAKQEQEGQQDES